MKLLVHASYATPLENNNVANAPFPGWNNFESSCEGWVSHQGSLLSQVHTQMLYFRITDIGWMIQQVFLIPLRHLRSLISSGSSEHSGFLIEAVEEGLRIQ